MDEIWIDLNREIIQQKTIIAVSNMGNMKLGSGIIKPIPLRQLMTYNGKLIRIYRFIAEHFIPKSEEDIKLNRNYVDHITHNPIGININDIRNLRWCTQKENCNFEESRSKASEASKGKHIGELNPFYCKHHNEETRKLISERTKEGLRRYYANRLQSL